MTLKQNKKVTFDGLTHSYWIEDKELAGVTTLMRKHGLSPDYGGIAPDVLAHAAARGTAVHRTLEAYDNGEAVVQPMQVDDNNGGFVTFDTSDSLNAYKELALRVVASEYLVSDNKVVASFVDKVLLTENENEVDLADIKTTSTLHEESLRWQLSIYAYLFEKQNKGIKVRNLYGIHVRNGKAVLRQVNRRDDREVKALIKAEAEGSVFMPKAEAMPQLSLVVGEGDLAELAKTETALVEAKALVAELSARIKERQDAIYEYMVAHNITEMGSPLGGYKLRRPTIRESFNSKKFKEEHPDTYALYVQRSEVKGSVSFTAINNN